MRILTLSSCLTSLGLPSLGLTSLSLTSLCLLALASNAHADSPSAGLYPPGLLPIINRANALLSAGEFADAAQSYSEAIDHSPTDYLLYYKRATAYFSLSRHAPALEDFEHVLALTHGTFPNALLMKAKIHLKDGSFALARQALKSYKGDDHKTSREILEAVGASEGAAGKAGKAKKTGLWNVCVESASDALGGASHSLAVRQMRAECSLAAGDVEAAVADLTRLTHLLPPSTALQTRIFRLSYFLLSPSSSHISTLKQCLHYDPDSKTCHKLHRLAKSLDKDFTTLDTLLAAEDWRGVVNLLDTAKGGKVKAKSDLLKRFDEAMTANTARDHLLPDSPPTSTAHASSTTQPLPLPDPSTASPRRQVLIRALCRAYVRLGDAQKGAHVRAMERWCTTLLGMEGCGEDVDGLVGKAEGLLKKEEWEEAVRVLEKAWEVEGRRGGDIHTRLQRAQKLLKQSKAKDYYKVLGVARDADARTIKKAFRKAAMTAHPDKGGSEAKMAAVNEAYEVLNNPELRQRFDNGDDPNDQSSGQGGYAHPFAGSAGGHPFAQFFQAQGHGGGFQFHFSHGG